MVAISGGTGLSVGTLVAGKYRLVKQIGEGAMGVVWSAVNAATNGEVALKLILRSEPELRQRLLREAQACGTIRHRNVVQMHDVGQSDTGDPFLVMELLQGETLADLLARKRRLPPQEAASVGRDVARALAAAHDKGIVHRDLKPANIFLHHEPGGDASLVKVLDFGVSKNFLRSDGLRTIAGGAVGSPMYMSPEQARAEREIDGRADVWSLGVVLYEMLTGERPFTGETTEVIARIADGEIPRVARRIRRIDPDFDEIVAGCLTRDRTARLGPTLAVARRLEAHAAPEGRGPLPSLMEIGPVELAAAAASGDAAFSPGMGSIALQASSSPGFGVATSPGMGPSASARMSSPGLGPTGLRPSSSGHGSTALDSSGVAGDDDDEATRPIDPSVLIPPVARRGPATAEPPLSTPQAAAVQPPPTRPGTGTVIMLDAPQAAAVQPPSARPGTGTVLMLDTPQDASWMPASAAGPKGTIRMSTASSRELQASARAYAQAPPQATNFNAFTETPSLRPAAPAAPSRSRRSWKAPLAIFGTTAVLGVALAVVAVNGRSILPEPAPTSVASPTTETTAPPATATPPGMSATPAPSPAVVTSDPAPDVPPSGAPSSTVAASSSAAPSSKPKASAPTPPRKPPARPPAPATAAPSVPCSKFGLPCKPPASTSVTDPWAPKKPKPSKPIPLPEGL